MNWKTFLKPNKVNIILFIILFLVSPTFFHINTCEYFPLFKIESDVWRICVSDIILTLLILYFLASFIANSKGFLKGFLKPNKINISLFVVLFIILRYFFFMLPATTCESLFLGDKFELTFPWSDSDTTMRAVNPGYETCAGISPIIFITLFAVIAYIVASLIADWYIKKKK